MLRFWEEMRFRVSRPLLFLVKKFVKYPISQIVSTFLLEIAIKKSSQLTALSWTLLSLVEISGIQPLLFVCLKVLLKPGGNKKDSRQAVSFRGGDKRDRTADLLNAIQALSQLSYTPI